MENYFHAPVLIKETLEALNCAPGETFFDGTVGGGGHAFEILKSTGPDGRLIGVDADRDAIKAARRKLAEFGKRAVLIHGNFIDIRQILQNLNIPAVQGILLDLGVSSHQLDIADRGFSFSSDAPLDMRFDVRRETTACDVVNTLSRRDLEVLFRQYGEEPMARRIASAIEEKRKLHPITTTRELAQLVINAVPAGRRSTRIHPATRVFQALRIAVNEELSNLDRAIDEAIEVLSPGGRFSIITFHSLEDRIVKEKFRFWEKPCTCPADFPKCICQLKPRLKSLTRKPVIPAQAEIENNPRARSAKLRTAERLAS